MAVENDIPAKKKAEEKRAWFQEKDENKHREKGAAKQKEKRKKEIDSIRPLLGGLFIDFLSA